ncbi:MAG TPA: DMT family transporter [Bacteroidales bacterium]|nr:DMT family transporter [Bacteroidales bacterium]
MERITRTYGAIILAMVIWSFSFIWFKIANEVYRPMTIVYLRLFLSVMILSLFLWITGRFEKIKRSDRKYFLLLAFCQPFVYFIGESHGLTYVTSTMGSVIISTVPIFAAIGGWIFFRERLKTINYLGIIISFTGVLVFILNRDGSLSFDLRGLLLLFLAVFSAVGYTLILNKLAGSYNPIYIVNVQNIIGLILFIPVIMISEVKHLNEWTFDTRSFSAIIKLAIFASSGAFILFGFAVRKLGVSRSSVFSNCIPVFTALFAYFILNEVLTFQKLTGMLVVIAGLFLSQANKKQKRHDREFLAGRTG